MTDVTLRFREENRDIFNDICSGKKTIETRAASSKFLGIKEGDDLLLTCGEDIFKIKVKKVEHYPSIEAMLEKIELKKIIPNANTLEEAKEIYYSFPHYKEKIEKNGILAFYI